MRKPYVPKKFIVSFLVEYQLPIAAEARVDFAVFIEIRCKMPVSISIVEVENCAFSDIDE